MPQIVCTNTHQFNDLGRQPMARSMLPTWRSRSVVDHEVTKTMEWITPGFVEVNMDTEIGRYQEDDNRPFVADED